MVEFERQFVFNETSCRNCNNTFEDYAAKLLPCLHIYCAKCLGLNETLNEVSKSQGVRSLVRRLVCPGCDSQYTSDEVTNSPFLQLSCSDARLDARLRSQLCSSCESCNPASSLCLECNDFLCTECVSAHKRVKVTRDHPLIDISPECLSQELDETRCDQKMPACMLCQVHPMTRIQLYCADCEIPICLLCRTQNHKEHRCSEISRKDAGSLGSVPRETLGNKLKCLKSKFNNVSGQKIMEQMSEKQNQVEGQKSQLTELRSKFDRCFSELQSFLEGIFDERLGRIRNKKEEIDKFSKKSKHTISFVEQLLQTSDDFTVLAVRSLVSKNIGALEDEIVSTHRCLIEDGGIGYSHEGPVCQTPSENKLLHGDTTRQGLVRGKSETLDQDAQDMPLHVTVKAEPWSDDDWQPMESCTSLTDNTEDGERPSPLKIQDVRSCASDERDRSTGSTNVSAVGSHFSTTDGSAAGPETNHCTPKKKRKLTEDNLNTTAGSSPVQSTPQLKHEVPSQISNHSGKTVGSSPVPCTSQLKHEVPNQVSNHSSKTARNSLVPSSSQLNHEEHSQDSNHSSNSVGSSPFPSTSQFDQQGPSPVSNYLNNIVGSSPVPSTSQLNHEGPSPVSNYLNNIVRSSPVLSTSQLNHEGHSPVSNHSTSTMGSSSGSSLSKLDHEGPCKGPKRTIWTGKLVWHDKKASKTIRITRQADFNVSVGSSDPEVDVSNWQQSLSMHLMQQSLLDTASVRQQLENSRRITFHPENVLHDDYKRLDDDLRAGYAGFVNLPINSSCDVRFLLLLYSAKKRAYMGLIPPDQRKVLKEIKARTRSRQRLHQDEFKERVSAYRSRHGVATKYYQSSHDPADPWEDVCRVCQMGGELVLCDFCPRVYHQQCYVPTLDGVPPSPWQCILCQEDLTLSYTDDDGWLRSRKQTSGGMRDAELMICERILLELYCVEESIIFHSPVSPENRDYYKIIKRPMHFFTIKERLRQDSADPYTSIEEFLSDVQLVFDNCYKFNADNDDIYQAGEMTEHLFKALVEDHMPGYNLDGAV